MLPFSVQFRPGIPAYEQVVFAAKRAIASGRLKPGEPFPSVRLLSRELQLTPNTCQKAVTVLVNEGLLEVRPGLGTTVCAPPELAAEVAVAELRQAILSLVIEARQRGLESTQLLHAITETWQSLEPEPPHS